MTAKAATTRRERVLVAVELLALGVPSACSTDSPRTANSAATSSSATGSSSAGSRESVTPGSGPAVGPGPTGGITVSDGDVSIRREDQFLVRVDTVTAEIMERFDEKVISAGNVQVAFGAVWATADDDNLLIRHDLAD